MWSIDQDTEKEKEEQENAPEPELEKVEEGTVKADVFKNYFQAVGIPYIIAIIGCYAASHGCGAGADIWLSKWEKGQNASGLNSTDELQHDSIRRLSVYGSIGVSKV